MTGVEYELAYRGVIAIPGRDLDQLDNRSLQCGCRPSLVPDMNISLLESARAKDNDND
jgi:hypothetical protein